MSKSEIISTTTLDELEELPFIDILATSQRFSRSLNQRSVQKLSSIHLPSMIGLFAEDYELDDIAPNTQMKPTSRKWSATLAEEFRNFKISEFRQRKGVQSNMGLIYMLTAALAWSFMSLCIKMMAVSNEPLPTFQIIFGRSVVVGIVSAIQCKVRGLSLLGPSEVRPLLLARGVVGFLGMSFGFMALTMLSIGDATSISFIAPIFTGIAAHFLLNERWQIVDAVAALFSLCGVTLIARPPFLFPTSASSIPVSSTGIVLALLSALTASCAFIIMRKLGKQVNPNQITLYFSVIPLFLCPLTLLSAHLGNWIIPQFLSTYFWFFSLSAAGYAGQMMFAKALQVETAAKASTYNFAQVFYSFLFEFLMFGKIPSSLSVAGAAIIGVSIISMTVYKLHQAKHAQDLPK